MEQKPLIYLASPYTAPTLAEEDTRYDEVSDIALALLKQGWLVFSPVVHWHPVVRKDGNCPGTWDFWKPYNLRMLAACDELWVVTMKGWHRSRGVIQEVVEAERLDKPIILVDPTNLTLTPYYKSQRHAPRDL